MWSKRSHLLHPLTALTSNKVNFKWTEVEQRVFYEIICIVVRDTSLVYLDFNKGLDIHTYDSDFHIGAVINQYGKPTTIYSSKLTGPQKRFTLTKN